MNEQSIVSELRRSLQFQADNWLSIGDALAQLEQLGSRDLNGVSWFELVAKIHHQELHKGVSSGHLRKVLRVRNFIRELEAEDGCKINDKEVLQASLTSLEIASRLYKLSKESGKEAFVDCISGKTIADLQRLYDKFIMDNPHRASNKTITWHKKRTRLSWPEKVQILEHVISKNLNIFCKSKAAVVKHIEQPLDKMRFFHDLPRIQQIDFIFAIRFNDDTELLGMHLVDGRSERSERLSAEIAEYRSSLFDQYWYVILQSQKMANEILNSLQQLQIRGVGVILVSDDKETHILQTPHSGELKPDRRNLIWEYIKHDLW